MSLEEAQVIVIDTGSQTCKAGTAGEMTPKSIFPTIIGNKKATINESNSDVLKDEFIGMKAQENLQDLLSVSPIIDRGIVTNFEHFEKLLNYTFKSELNMLPNEHSVILTEMTLTEEEKIQREKKTELIFEKFNSPSFYLGHHSILSLYANGRTTGVVVNSGHDITHVVAVCDGKIQKQAAYKLPVGGRDVTKYLSQLLTKNIENFKFLNEEEKLKTAQDIKEKFANFLDKRMYGTDKEQNYELPDGTVLTFTLRDDVVTECGELLFKPNLLNEIYNNTDISNNNNLGIHELVNTSIMNCDINFRKELYLNIVLSGGNTLFKGFGARLSREVEDISPSMVAKTIENEERKIAEWIGGSIVGSMHFFSERCLSIAEYKEVGVSIIHRKWF